MRSWEARIWQKNMDKNYYRARGGCIQYRLCRLWLKFPGVVDIEQRKELFYFAKYVRPEKMYEYFNFYSLKKLLEEEKSVYKMRDLV